MRVYRTCIYYNIIAYVERVRGLGPEAAAAAGPRQRCARDNANANYNALIYPFRVAKWRAPVHVYNTILLLLCCTSIHL